MNWRNIQLNGKRGWFSESEVSVQTNSLRFYEKISRSAAYTKRAKTEFTLTKKLPLKSILIYKYVKDYTNSNVKLCQTLNTLNERKE